MNHTAGPVRCVESSLLLVIRTGETCEQPGRSFSGNDPSSAQIPRPVRLAMENSQKFAAASFHLAVAELL